MDIIESITRVLAVGLILGAGLPALFAVGMRLVARGAGDAGADGTAAAPNPVFKLLGYALFAFVAAVIVLGILWITRDTLNFHFGWKIFPDFAY